MALARAPLSLLLPRFLFSFFEENFFYQFKRHEKNPCLLRLLPIHPFFLPSSVNYLLWRMSGPLFCRAWSFISLMAPAASQRSELFANSVRAICAVVVVVVCISPVVRLSVRRPSERGSQSGVCSAERLSIRASAPRPSASDQPIR